MSAQKETFGLVETINHVLVPSQMIQTRASLKTFLSILKPKTLMKGINYRKFTTVLLKKEKIMSSILVLGGRLLTSQNF